MKRLNARVHIGSNLDREFNAADKDYNIYVNSIYPNKITIFFFCYQDMPIFDFLVEDIEQSFERPAEQMIHEITKSDKYRDLI